MKDRGFSYLMLKYSNAKLDLSSFPPKITRGYECSIAGTMTLHTHEHAAYTTNYWDLL